MMNCCPVLFASLLVAFPAAAQGEQPPPTEKPSGQPAQDPAAVLAEMLAQFQQEGIVYDGKAGTVSLPAVVNVEADLLEYLLIHRKGKKHEALFYTQAKPSLMNGALLLLGLEPGQNADYKEKDPAPTLEEIEQGADPVIVIPPKGKPLWMTVKWKDEAGKAREEAVEDLLLDLTTGKTIGAMQWVYLGGRMAPLYKNEPPVFVADFEGNLVSICYLLPTNHLATMVHERARDDQNWWRTDRCPPVGTEVTFVFHRAKPEVVEAREQRLAEEARRAKESGGDAAAPNTGKDQ